MTRNKFGLEINVTFFFKIITLMIWKTCVAKPSRVISVSNGIFENAKDTCIDSREISEKRHKSISTEHNSEISIGC